MTKTGRIVYSTHSNAARIYANILSEELGIGFSDFKIHKDDVRTTENVVYIGRVGQGALVELMKLRRHSKVRAAILLIGTDGATFSEKPVKAIGEGRRKMMKRIKKLLSPDCKFFVVYVPRRFEQMSEGECKMYMQHVDHLRGLIISGRRTRLTQNRGTRDAIIRRAKDAEVELAKLDTVRNYPTLHDVEPFITWNKLRHDKIVYLIRGPLGIPLDSIGKAMQPLLSNSIYVNGDEVMCASSDIAEKEREKLFLDNTLTLLKSYVNNDHCDYIVYTLTTHDEKVIESIREKIESNEIRVVSVTVTASVEKIKKAICESQQYDLYGRSCLDETLKNLRAGCFNTDRSIDVTRMSISMVAYIIVNKTKRARKENIAFYDIARIGRQVYRIKRRNT